MHGLPGVLDGVAGGVCYDGGVNTLQRITGDYRVFLIQILREMAAEGFDMADFVQLDHMCYRVASPDDYERKKTEFACVGWLLGETIVNGRPIAVFRLHKPVQHGRWRIDAIEVPAPKPGVLTREGLEHVEFVLFDDQKTFLEKYRGKRFELKAADRGINPEIAYKLPSYGVKFHLLSLTTVVYLERKLGLEYVRDGQ